MLQQSGNEEQRSDAGEHLPSTEENCAVFAAAITRTAQDIDTLIESLPNQEYTPEMQNESLRRLEEENKRSAERLAKVVEEGEALLQDIQESLRQICDSQLRKPNT